MSHKPQNLRENFNKEHFGRTLSGDIKQAEVNKTDSSVNVEAVVMQQIMEWSNDYSTGWDGVWKGFDMLSKITNISIRELKEVVRKLSKEGKLELRETYNQDGQLHGKGYFVA